MKFAFMYNLLLFWLGMLACQTHKDLGNKDMPDRLPAKQERAIIPAAERTDAYLPYLTGKKIAVFANQTSRVGNKHLIDTLSSLGLDILRIFSPEHGFRGSAEAGEKVMNGKDPLTGIPIISLYGDHKKPLPEDLAGVDLILFDIQDVGARFYTYISSLEYVMEASLENGKQLIILDRPNPNGWYIDGPVLNRKYKSFVGMQPVPIVYGMTIGEYALMIAGEGWLGSEKANKLFYEERMKKSNEKSVIVIPCDNYDHAQKYRLPVNPSPNLKEMQSVYLYPSTCLFEGTILSEGRGTDKPFQLIGHPTLPASLFSFTPTPHAGAKSGKCFFETCHGWNLSGPVEDVLEKVNGKVQIKYLIEAYKQFPGKDSFFIKENFFQKSGNDILMKQIIRGTDEQTIRKSWEPELSDFKKRRKKYLLYKDFY